MAFMLTKPCWDMVVSWDERLELIECDLCS